jgi:hypothetical protein
VLSAALVPLAIMGACAAPTNKTSSGSTGSTPSSGSSGSGGGACAGTEELCNGSDDNCDGQVDEGCSCKQGETQKCYSGPKELEGKGACKAGEQICDDRGNWGACTGEVVPGSEKCNGLDDDCDGQLDEELGTITCGLGACKTTVEACAKGMPVPCIPPKGSDKEKCDGVDDNCDGKVDEGCNCLDGKTQACYTGSKDTQGKGACKDGTQTCMNGAWGACTGDITPQPETCNGIDDNCDGFADEKNPGGGGSCDTGKKGVCAAGKEACEGGKIVCNQLVASSTEKCNGLDDNCSGQADEGNPEGGGTCDTGLLGACKVGAFKCQDAKLKCSQTVQPTPEKCNNIDDNCSGQTDEGNPEGGGDCNTGLKGVCAAGKQKCQAGQLVCSQTTQDGPETCNNLDDDCDGMVDEGNPGGGNACSTGLQGVCSAGIDTCTNGQVICKQSVQSTAEGSTNCSDAKDNDCDGKTDVSDSDCACSHALCTTGAKLFIGCATNNVVNQCVTDICKFDPFCCNNSWDSLCVERVRTVCKSLTCSESKGNCPTAPCDAGAASTPFTSNCDSAKAACVAKVCAADSYCCTNDWDSICVDEVTTKCGNNCTYK